MRFETVIFDLDGTVLDTLPDLVHVTNTTIQEAGFPPRTTAEIHSFVGGGGRDVIKLSVPEDVSEERLDAMFARWKELYVLIGLDLTTYYPGMLETLEKLHESGVNLGILSNKVEPSVLMTIDRFYPDLFSVVHGERSGYPKKPRPEGLIACLEEMDANPETTLYVGDSWRDQATVDNIRTAGFPQVQCALCTWGYTPRQVLEDCAPDFLLDKPEELLAIVLNDREN